MADDWIRPCADGWPPSVAALTTTRADGDPRDAAARRALARRAGVARVQWLAQVHGHRWVEAGSGTLATVPEADAAWTRESNLALAVLTADCVPAVVAARDGSFVGVAHGGWRGLVGGVLENLVRALPGRPCDMVAWLGPAIGPEAYEVGDDVVAAVAALADGPDLARECVRPAAPGKAYLDLFSLSERLLQGAGVNRVISDRLCTYTDSRFFSYRREGQTGRLVTLAWLD